MYSTLDDIKAKLPEETLLQLTDDDSLGEIDQAKIDAAITEADSEIDGYCSTRYTVPFAVVPAVIKKVSVDLAIYHLYARRVEKMPEVREVNRNNAVGLLKDISRGMVKLGEVATTAPVQPQQSPVITSSPRLFSRDKMKGL